MNAAELGLANLKMAMRDQSLMSEVAEGMRKPEGRAELVRIMADPRFQKQAQGLVGQMKASGILTDFLKLEYYGALNAGGAFGPSMGKADAPHSSSASRHTNVRMETSSMGVSPWPDLSVIVCTKMASIGLGNSRPLCQTTPPSRAYLHQQCGMRLRRQVASRSFLSLVSLNSGRSQATCSSRTAQHTTCVVGSRDTSQRSRKSHILCHSISLIHSASLKACQKNKSRIS